MKINYLLAGAMMIGSLCFAPTIYGAKKNEKNRNQIWFDSAPSSTTGAGAWKQNDFSTSAVNPDPNWERKSFPIGNGSFGAAVLGSVNRERLVLNEKTLWLGGPATGVDKYWAMNKKVAPELLDSIRQLLLNGKNNEAHYLTATNFNGTVGYDRSRFGTYTMLGEAYIGTGLDEAKVENYRRSLDMDDATVSVDFDVDGTHYTRKYFCSYPDSVMVWKFTSKGKPQDLTFSLDSPHKPSQITSPRPGSLLFEGELEGNGMKWALRVDVRTAGKGKVSANAQKGTIEIANANDVEFLLTADTDYRINFDPDFKDPKTYVGNDPKIMVNSSMDAARKKSYSKLYQTHTKDYQALFNRVKLEINPDSTVSELPTYQRLANYRKGAKDYDLERLYFQFGRYLTAASSRKGTMPANLQGLWHNNLDGPWKIDYHNNINVQMNYWPTLSTNMEECYQPLIDYIQGLIKPGTVTAQSYYGARGWTAGISTNLFGFTAPLSPADMSWNYNPSAGPWLATQLWDYYDYTRDKKWLEEVGYPMIKGSADFAADILFYDGQNFTSAPSYSPEHGNCDLGATYANAVTREILTDAIKAATILGVDKESVSEWQDKLNKIRPYKIGQYGQLQEWYNDIDDPKDQHRHTNHLFGLHPGSSINALKDSALVEACKETLRERGDAATGWSMGWKLNHWARLLDGNHAYVLYQNLLKNGTADNMWDMHPPFQIDGNFGGTAGVSELFLQTHNGVLQLLPALPEAWKDGKVSGLRARGNFEVDIEFADGKLKEAVVRSNSGEPCKVVYNNKTIDLQTRKGGEYKLSADRFR